MRKSAEVGTSRLTLSHAHLSLAFVVLGSNYVE